MENMFYHEEMISIYSETGFNWFSF